MVRMASGNPEDLIFKIWNLFTIVSGPQFSRRDPIFRKLLRPRIPFSSLFFSPQEHEEPIFKIPSANPDAVIKNTAAWNRGYT